jgi:hypothetical protein
MTAINRPDKRLHPTKLTKSPKKILAMQGPFTKAYYPLTDDWPRHRELCAIQLASSLGGKEQRASSFRDVTNWHPHGADEYAGHGGK